MFSCLFKALFQHSLNWDDKDTRYLKKNRQRMRKDNEANVTSRPLNEFDAESLQMKRDVPSQQKHVHVSYFQVTFSVCHGCCFWVLWQDSPLFFWIAENSPIWKPNMWSKSKWSREHMSHRHFVTMKTQNSSTRTLVHGRGNSARVPLKQVQGLPSFTQPQYMLWHFSIEVIAILCLIVFKHLQDVHKK